MVSSDVGNRAVEIDVVGPIDREQLIGASVSPHVPSRRD